MLRLHEPGIVKVVEERDNQGLVPSERAIMKGVEGEGEAGGGGGGGGEVEGTALDCKHQISMKNTG